jgi:trans-aconitate 2-methyltransferase
MPSWDSAQYLKFNDERTRPAIDLAARIALPEAKRIVDLGCGPGNSTAVVARRWPEAQVLGLDSSPAMIAAAQRDHPKWAWRVADIANWSDDGRYDVVFSNAALQWVPNHAEAIPRIFDRVAEGGALAVQVPANIDATPHRLMREIAAQPSWRDFFPEMPREWAVASPEFYYDTLARIAARVELWLTDYIHILDGPSAIVEWYRGTGLRPWLEALPSPEEQARYLADYGKAITEAFPTQSDGRVLFPFRRLFFIAYR